MRKRFRREDCAEGEESPTGKAQAEGFLYPLLPTKEGDRCQGRSFHPKVEEGRIFSSFMDAEVPLEEFSSLLPSCFPTKGAEIHLNRGVMF